MRVMKIPEQPIRMQVTFFNEMDRFKPLVIMLLTNYAYIGFPETLNRILNRANFSGPQKNPTRERSIQIKSDFVLHQIEP